MNCLSIASTCSACLASAGARDLANEVSDRFLQDYVGRVDLTNTAILGYFDGDEMRGAAELRSMRKTWCAAAEAAFSVEAQWRSRGIGSGLMLEALALAQELGVQQIHLICERHNRPMQRIAERVCADSRCEGGDYLAQITVPKRRSHKDFGLYFAAWSASGSSAVPVAGGIHSR